MSFYPVAAKVHIYGDGLDVKTTLRAKYIEVDSIECPKCGSKFRKNSLEDRWARTLYNRQDDYTEMMKKAKANAQQLLCPHCDTQMILKKIKIVKLTATNMPHMYINLGNLLRAYTYFNFVDVSTRFVRREAAAYIDNVIALNKGLEESTKMPSNGRIKCKMQIFPITEEQLEKDFKQYISRKVVKAL